MKINKNIEKPICVGSGLIALDVIINQNSTKPNKICVGGSCGNVLSILSFMGWNSKPIARLSNNHATEIILEDFSKFNVNTDLLTFSNDGETPVIIQRLLKDKFGNSKHKFEFKIPQTNKWLPQYKPVLAKTVEQIISKQSHSKVFYFDRVSRATINLAKYYRSQGALIIFEPSSIKDDKQFQECLEVTHILKFSDERIKNYQTIYEKPVTDLEVETLGASGLRYRMKKFTGNDWIVISANKLENIVDSAGAGDWCTAGIISHLGLNGEKSFLNSSKDDIENALINGQALGAINCLFEGARGIMYNMDYNDLMETLTLLNKKIELKKNIKKEIKEIIVQDNFNFEKLL